MENSVKAYVRFHSQFEYKLLKKGTCKHHSIGSKHCYCHYNQVQRCGLHAMQAI